MRVEIIELLRCPASHELTPLVAVADKRDGDRLIAATLGCPVCGAEFLVRGGVAYLETGASLSPTRDVVGQSDALRLAALLNLAEPGRRVVLCGAVANVATELREIAEVHCVLLNVSGTDAKDSQHDIIQTDALHRVPLADASIDALAIDDAHIHWLPEAARVVRSGGRVLAPVHATVPDGCTELARDASEWVAEVRVTPSTPVMLRRAPVGGS